MSEATHSPLPWEVDEDGNIWGDMSIAQIHYADDFPCTDTEERRAACQAMCEANAALIVRAVNAHTALVAACEAYEAALVAVLKEHPTAEVSIAIGFQVAEAREKGRAALALART